MPGQVLADVLTSIRVAFLTFQSVIFTCTKSNVLVNTVMVLGGDLIFDLTAARSFRSVV